MGASATPPTPATPIALPIRELQPSRSHATVSVGDAAAMRNALLDAGRDLVVTLPGGGSGLVRAVPWSSLGPGSAAYMEMYNVKYPLYCGAMAKGIASAEMVIAAGTKGMLASLGAGGLPLDKVTQFLDQIQAELPNGPYAVNLIHSPFDEGLEEGGVELFLQRGVRVIEASAFMTLTKNIVRYRVAGLEPGPAGGPPVCRNKVIFKVSRTELAQMAMRSPPADLVEKCLKAGHITPQQAALAPFVTMCDDVAVEADSGGHTDNRPMPVLLPVIIATRDAIAAETGMRVRVGAGGGLRDGRRLRGDGHDQPDVAPGGHGRQGAEAALRGGVLGHHHGARRGHVRRGRRAAGPLQGDDVPLARQEAVRALSRLPVPRRHPGGDEGAAR